MKAFGRYNQTTNIAGKLSLPSTNSKNNYLGVSLPNEFNMTIKLLDSNNTHFIINTNNSNSFNNIILIGNESKIDLYGISAESPVSKTVNILLKNPEILLNGSVMFEKTNFYGQEIDDYIPINVNGEVKTTFDFIDDFKEPYRNGIKTDYLSYIGSLNIDGKRDQVEFQLDLPGDISSDIEKRGLGVPIGDILTSSANFIIISVIAIALIIVILLHRRTFSHDSSFTSK